MVGNKKKSFSSSSFLNKNLKLPVQNTLHNMRVCENVFFSLSLSLPIEFFLGGGGGYMSSFLAVCIASSPVIFFSLSLSTRPETCP
jgi:hypothetical protein